MQTDQSGRKVRVAWARALVPLDWERLEGWGNFAFML